MKKPTTTPVLIGYRKNNASYVWCPYCIKYHIHGEVNGHRIAHCIKETPFKDTGYYILTDHTGWNK